jgi:ribosome biogenesis protein ERB1
VFQLSKQQSQDPLKKLKGKVQCVSFHPNKPFFFVATQTQVRVYNLVTQTLVRKLRSGAKWISSMEIHPSGDHCSVGSYDKRVVWFDMDLSEMPFKTLRYHSKAVRRVRFHKHYPLMATCSDDGSIHIFHTRVFNDLTRNPLIVPVKVLRGHDDVAGLSVLDISFHATEPWLFSCGADGSVYLYQNLV